MSHCLTLAFVLNVCTMQVWELEAYERRVRAYAHEAYVREVPPSHAMTGSLRVAVQSRLHRDDLTSAILPRGQWPRL